MTDTLALGRPLPHVSLQTGHWSNISSANRRTGSVDPEPREAGGRLLRDVRCGFWLGQGPGELAQDGITVNCVAPGRIATDRVADLDRVRANREGLEVGEVERQSRQSIPVGRYGQPEELAALAAFLLSERAG
jgi:3-oxoacyl-[acyl-carrier protein] reductase